MLVSTELAANFSRGRALLFIAHYFPATHPHAKRRTGAPLKGLRSDEDWLLH